MRRAVQDSQSSDDAAEAATAHPTIGVLMVLAGFREPIVVILLTIAFFTTISGKPLDGVLMLLVAVSLVIDAGRALRFPSRVPPIGEVLSRAMRTRTGRVGMLVAWAWLGLHFFAR
jgi:hypothetical protein